MLINTPAPDFTLPDTAGHIHKLSAYRGRIVAVNFWSAECPWSERADQHLVALSKQFHPAVAILPVASNLNETNKLIDEAVHQRSLDFVLLDSGYELADAWGAQTTPHTFIVDQSGILRYQGAIDDVTFRKRSPDRNYVEQAVTALLADLLPEVQETQPYGCTIVRSI